MTPVGYVRANNLPTETTLPINGFLIGVNTDTLSLFKTQASGGSGGGSGIEPLNFTTSPVVGAPTDAPFHKHHLVRTNIPSGGLVRFLIGTDSEARQISFRYTAIPTSGTGAGTGMFAATEILQIVAADGFICEVYPVNSASDTLFDHWGGLGFDTGNPGNWNIGGSIYLNRVTVTSQVYLEIGNNSSTSLLFIGDVISVAYSDGGGSS